ncbi:hypothetical protein H9P43_006584 [Blastocladiella emersonii ATCC 22665]|nr:hypothetical protein H9P43_006584 [Blastocladiella emersonii ATCC 22665]
MAPAPPSHCLYTAHHHHHQQQQPPPLQRDDKVALRFSTPQLLPANYLRHGTPDDDHAFEDQLIACLDKLGSELADEKVPTVIALLDSHAILIIADFYAAGLHLPVLATARDAAAAERAISTWYGGALKHIKDLPDQNSLRQTLLVWVREMAEVHFSISADAARGAGTSAGGADAPGATTSSSPTSPTPTSTIRAVVVDIWHRLAKLASSAPHLSETQREQAALKCLADAGPYLNNDAAICAMHDRAVLRHSTFYREPSETLALIAGFDLSTAFPQPSIALELVLDGKPDWRDPNFQLARLYLFVKTWMGAADVFRDRADEGAAAVTRDRAAAHLNAACVLAPTWEKAHHFTAEFYYSWAAINAEGNTEKLMQTISPNAPDFFDRLARLERYFAFCGRSLLLGSRYADQSVPVLLQRWMDLADPDPNHNPTPVIVPSLDPSLDGDGVTEQRLEAFHRVHPHVRAAVTRAPADTFEPCIELLVSRLTHGQSVVFNLIKPTLVRSFKAYPEGQSFWKFVASLFSLDDFRRIRAEEVLHAVWAADDSEDKQLTLLTKTIMAISKQLTTIAAKEHSKDRAGSFLLSVTHRRFTKVIPIDAAAMANGAVLLNRCNVVVPTAELITPTLPGGPHSSQSQARSPYATPDFLRAADDEYEVISTMSRPRKIAFRGGSGTTYTFLIKGVDDPRKDALVMRVAQAINRILSRSAVARGTHLRMHDYAVIPLSDVTGMFEWIATPTVALREAIVSQYVSALRASLPANPHPSGSAEQLAEFERRVRAHAPARFGEWFDKEFSCPAAARQAFLQSTAVSSMVGYLLGIGDRHLGNILVSRLTGEAMHIDFGIMFKEGKRFSTWPEQMPVRLTQNLVQALGGVEEGSVFRRVFESVLEVCHKNAELILAAVDPIRHDPIANWRPSVEEVGDDGKTKKRVRVISSKSTRVAVKRGCREYHKIELRLAKCHAPEAQVDKLIRKSTDPERLARGIRGLEAWY